MDVEKDFRRFSAEYKRDILKAARLCEDGTSQLSVLLRQEKLTRGQLQRWEAEEKHERILKRIANLELEDRQLPITKLLKRLMKWK